MQRRIFFVGSVLVCLTLMLSFFLDEQLLKGAFAEKGEGAGIQELPLGIQKIYLKGNKVHIIIVRTGGGKIDPGDYSKIKMKVDPGSGKPLRQWSLADVDRHKVLSAAGGKIEFDTGIVLEKGGPVKAILSLGKWETSKQEALSLTTTTALAKAPPISEKADDSKTTTSKTMMAQRKLPDDSSQTHLMKARAIISEQGLNRPEVKPRLLDGGIRIRRPEGGSITSRTFILHYVIDSRKEDGDITFYLVIGGNIVDQATHRFVYPGTRSSTKTYSSQYFTWAIPPDLPDSDRCAFIAVKSDASGISDVFSMRLRHTLLPISQGLSVNLDGTRTIFPIGETLRMNFTINGPRGEAFNNLQLSLNPYRDPGSGGEDRRTPINIPIATGGAATLINYDWIVVATTPTGKYRFYAKAEKVGHPEVICEGYSRVIEIVPVPPPPIPEADRITLRIDLPQPGNTFGTGSDSMVYVGWYCTVGRVRGDVDAAGRPVSYSFAYILMKGGVDRWRIGPVSYYGRDVFNGQFGVAGYENGNDYQVRIELLKEGEGGSWVLVKSVTSRNFNIRFY